MAGFIVFCLIPPHIPSPTRKWKTRPYETCFLGSDGFVNLPPYILHLYNPKNPVQMAGFMLFCLIPPHIPSPTRKRKTRPLRTCFLASGEFVYLPPYILHLHNPRNPIRNDRVLGYCLIPYPFPPPPEISKHVHYGRVFWLRVTSFTFPHSYSTSTTQETQSEMTRFGVIASFPTYFPLTWKLKTCPLRTCFLA